MRRRTYPIHEAAIYEAERAKLAQAIHKRVNSSVISRTAPYSVGDAERAAAGVILEGWTPPPGYTEEEPDDRGLRPHHRGDQKSMKIEIKNEPERGVSWTTDDGQFVAYASSTLVETADSAPDRVLDAARAAGRELAANRDADLRHYLGMTLPPDEVVP